MTLAKKMLVELINRTNNTAVKAETLRFATPHKNTVASIDRDTYCVVSGIFKEGFFGSKRYYYNRLDLAKIFNKVAPLIRSEENVLTTIHQVVPLLVARYGLRIEPVDVVDDAVDTSSLPYSFTLKAVEGSHAWQGEVVVTISSAELPYLSDVVLNTDLGDLNLGEPSLPGGDLGDLELG